MMSASMSVRAVRESVAASRKLLPRRCALTACVMTVRLSSSVGCSAWHCNISPPLAEEIEGWGVLPLVLEGVDVAYK